MAKEFDPSSTRFVACPVRLADISVHPNGDYPNKVKARAVSGKVYEVDEDGDRIKDDH